MASNAGERDVARKLGFGPRRPRPLPRAGVATSSSDGASLAEKLGLRPGMRVSLVRLTDPALDPLRTCGLQRVSPGTEPGSVDAIIYQVESSFSLRRIPELASQIGRGAALWVLLPTNQRTITESHVIQAAKVAGLKPARREGVTGRLAGIKFIRSPEPSR